MPVTLAEVGAMLEKRYRRHAGEWLVRAAAGEPFASEAFTLTYRKAEAAADIKVYDAWEAAWYAVDDPGLRVVREPAAWRDLGRTERPAKLFVLSLKAAFSLMPQGKTLGRAFLTALKRFDTLTGPVGERLRAAYLEETQFALTADAFEFERMTGVLQWLYEHPQANCYVRELPIVGIDTKWFEKNLGLTARFLTTVFAEATPIRAADIAVRWNLLLPPALIRVRHADLIVPGLPADELVALPASVLERGNVSRVAVVENLQTGLTLDVPRDVLIVTGMGAAVKVLSDVGWAPDADIVYMGDLDQHGVAILADVRQKLPQVRSVLMDETVLRHWRRLAVCDPTAPIRTPAVGLTESEAALFQHLQVSRLRLEQERLPIGLVSRAFQAAFKEAKK